jgi:phosphatidylinositol phospholipase C delta
LEVVDKGIVDPYVEVTLYVPEWPVVHHGVVGDDGQKDKGKEEVTTHKEKETTKTTKTTASEGEGTDDDDFYHVNEDDKTPPSRSISLPLLLQPPPSPTVGTTPARSKISSRTSVVKKNGFNPVWEEKLNIRFDCVGDMMDLVFVRFVVRQEKDKDGEEPLAVYCASMGSLQFGYRHLPLHDSQLSQYLFSTLFVKMNVISL